MLILGEKWVKMQKLVFFCYVIHLSELHRISHFPLKSNIRFRSYGGSKGLFESFHKNERSDRVGAVHFFVRLVVLGRCDILPQFDLCDLW